MDRKQIGRLGMSYAIAYYTDQGYTISIPLNDTQWYDLIIEKDHVFQTVQCKATTTADGQIDLRCTGGTNGGVYAQTTDYPIDRLFCLDAQYNMYDIPMADILASKKIPKHLTLRTTPPLNNQGFLTYKYLVSLKHQKYGDVSPVA